MFEFLFQNITFTIEIYSFQERFPSNTEMDAANQVDKTSSDEVSVISCTIMKEIQNSRLKVKSNKCDICERTFAFNSHLIIHKRSHSGEKPFSCDICEKSFAIQSSLNKHKLTHTSEKCLTCKMCNKTFSRKHIFQAHMRSHTEQ